MNNPWYKRVGFHNNPFSIKPAAFRSDLVAYDMEYIYDKIDSAELLFIEGQYGTGKTSILKNIINNYRGKNKIIYYNFNKGDRFDVRDLLDGANSIWRKVSGLKVKNIVMLLDEVHTMKQKDAKEIMDYYKKGVLQSVIFVTHAYDAVSFPEEVDTLLNGNVLKTISLSDEEAVEFVRKRIGDIDLLTDDVIVRLFKASENNPRRLLEFAEDVSRYAVEMGDYEVTDFHLEEVLGDIIKEAKNVRKAKPKKVEAKTEEVADDSIVVEETAEKKAEKKPKKKTKKSKAKPKIEKDDGQLQLEELNDLNEAEETVDKVSKDVESDADEEFIDIRELDSYVSASEDKPKAVKSNKKFKVNKLVGEGTKNALGTVSEREVETAEKVAEEDDVPEYNIYYMD